MKYLLVSLMFVMLLSFSCKKNNGSSVVNPTDLVVNAIVSTDNSGNVSFTATAKNAATYEYDFGNGIFQTVSNGAITYKYPSSGNYTVTVKAKSSGGQSISKSVNIVVTVALSLVWSDEFDGSGAPSSSKWGYDLGAGGWGNNEVQNYTNRTDNASVSNGTLKITLKAESYSGSAYTSARILTKDKFSFKYGKVEVRAKLPAGGGTWPAIWMLGSNLATVGWPACGEIDIMEHKGNDVNRIYGTFHHPGHSGGNADGKTTVITNATTDFHRYGLEWTASTIKVMVDDVVFYTFPNSASLPFNQNFFIILNVAMGGTFGGAVDPSFTSAAMEVDYVRVYQ
ncbi:MAG: family 16 glycosylhydrolase [Lacibacter sp.]